jgi:uncharacterized peroxidase-related enzyme
MSAAQFVDAVKRDWRTAGLPAPDAALCAYAEKLTLTPAACGAADVAALRAVGFDDVAIHDAVQAIGYFNYINRVADGLGVDLEPEMQQPAH